MSDVCEKEDRSKEEDKQGMKERRKGGRETAMPVCVAYANDVFEKER